jgi:DNA-binding transcriptional regulator YdaS (Cro superfamily)
MSADLQLLADYCSQHSQRAAATLLGYSATTINQVLNGTYAGDSARVLATVRERLVDTWLAALRAEALRTTQGQVARRVGLGESTVSQVLSGTYKAATVRIERRVRGALMGATCTCPVMGEVNTRVCQDVQERQPGKHGIGNPQHAQAWHACRGSGRHAAAGVCPHFNSGGRKPATSTTPEGTST